MWGDHGLASYVCECCAVIFKASPLSNAWCPKCSTGHILCPACDSVHKLSASEQDHYLATLETK